MVNGDLVGDDHTACLEDMTVMSSVTLISSMEPLIPRTRLEN
jgi:hypothetical protein